MSVNNILSETAVSRKATLARDEVLFRSKMKMEWDKVKHHSLDYLTWREGFTKGWLAGLSHARETR